MSASLQEPATLRGTAGQLLDLGSEPALLDSDIYEQVDENNQRHIAKTCPIAPGGIGNGYVADKQGELAFAFTGDRESFLTLHESAEGKWVKTPVDLETTGFVTAGDRPGESWCWCRAPAWATRGGCSGCTRRRPDPARGAAGQVYEFDGTVFRDELTRDIVGVSFDRAGPEALWFDESYRAVQKLLDASFPKQVARINDGDRNGRLLVATSSDRQPSIYHWVNLAPRTAAVSPGAAGAP